MAALVKKKDFPWFASNPGLAYLDNSATSLKPKAMVDAVVDYYERFSTNPHANDAPVQQSVVSHMESVREKLARFINGLPEEVAFTSGATLSLNMAAHAFANELAKGDEVIVSEADHSSALLPFYELRKSKGIVLRFVPLRGDRVLPEDYLALVNKKTRIVVITSASNTMGYLLDVASLIKGIKAKSAWALTIVDATQHLPHAPVDVRAMGCDFLAASAHKMLGPTGLGFLFIKKELQGAAVPYISGGSMNFDIGRDEYSYMENIHKFEAGTPNAAGIYGTGAAIDYLSHVGMDQVYAHDLALKQYVAQRLSAIKGLVVHNPTTELAIVAFNMDGINAQDLAFYLGKKGIVCRSGLSCSKLVRRELKVPLFVRASFYIYNDEHDADLLVKALEDFKPGDEINAVI